jgi:ribose transport system permease protein
MSSIDPASNPTPAPRPSPRDWILKIFLHWGVMPFLLVIAVITFSLMSSRFLTSENLINLLRQSVYLVLVSLGQMLALISGGFDLSVGTIVALASVVSALTMGVLAPSFPDAIWLVISLGCLAGLAAAMLMGVVNGAGVAVFGVSPFIMTLGMQSVGFGIALFLTAGVPVSNLPDALGDTFGFGVLMGIPVPILMMLSILALMFVLLNYSAWGRHLYAVGSNPKAALLSGIEVKPILISAYVLCALIAGISGLLLTARTASGDANLGGSMALESIAACVIGGVSLRGGIGRLENVVLGAIFIGLVQNGMNLAQIGSYLQIVVLGMLLIVAVVFDRIRQKRLYRL